MAVSRARMQRRLLARFDGGLNLRDAPGEVKDNESPDMMNMTLDERGGVVKRLGFQRDNEGALYRAETAPASSSGNEITDTTRATGTSGDGWPYNPYTIDNAGGETALVASGASAWPWSDWEGLSVANQLFYGTASPTPRQSTNWVKYVVRPGDQYLSTTGERSEHRLDSSIEADGQEHWYRWSTMFPSDFVRPAGWFIFTQLHSDSRFTQSAFKWQLDTIGGVDYIGLVITCGPFADAAQALNPIESNNLRFQQLAGLNLGLWQDFIVRIRFSASGNGLVQMWHRVEGEAAYTQVINQDNIYTLPTTIGDPTPGTITPKQGLYRAADAVRTTTLFHDGFARGNSYAELLYTYSPPTAMGTVGIWPATTNLHTNGGCETNTTGWTARNGATLSRVTSEHKFGTAALQIVTDSAQSSSSGELNIALTNGQKYAWSAWVKGTAGVRCRIYAVDGVSATLATTSFTCDGSWQKQTVLFTATANNNHGLRIGQTASGSSRTYFVDGAQCENLPSETPYVETNGGTASRSAARVQYAASGAITATQGYVAAEWRMGWLSSTGLGGGTGTPRHFDWTLDANNYIRCYYDEATGSWKLERKAAGTGSTVTVAAAHTRRQRVVVTAAWTATQIKLSINGFAFVTQADTNIPSGMPANFDLGSSAGTAQHIGSDKKWVSFGTGTLTDADALLLAESDSNPFATVSEVNLFYSEALRQLIMQLGTKLYKRTGAGTYVEITRTGPADAFTTAKVVGFAELSGNLYVAHPDDGILKYTGSGFIAVVNATAKGSSLATWQNKLWTTGVNSTVWWSNAGNGDTWTTATDFIQIRDVNDDACTALGFGQALDSGAVPEAGLLVYKRFSTHRIVDSATGEYKTLSAEAGAAGPRAIAHLSGVTMTVNDKGVWITDGEQASLLASSQINPLFRPNTLAMDQLDNIACGIQHDRFVISITRSGETVNDLTIEFHPQLGWFAVHDCAMAAYAVNRASDYSLYALSTDGNPNLVRMFTGGSDDQLANGTPGDDIACRFRTRWFEPVNGSLVRLRRCRLQFRGGFDLTERIDFDNSFGELVLATTPEAVTSAIYGTSIYGIAIYGTGAIARERYEDVYSLGVAKSWQFEIREDSSDSAFFTPPLLDTGDPDVVVGTQSGAIEVGSVALYEMHFDYVPLGYA